MYIIDKNKDYYDYYSRIYGIDKAITFDRRGSMVIDDLKLANLSWKYPLMISHILLEAGNSQYLIKLNNAIIKNRWGNDVIIACKMELVRTFADNKHYYTTPLSVRGVDVGYKWAWKYDSHRKYLYDRPFGEIITESYIDAAIDLPILDNTQITHLIDGKEIWIALNTYLSSLKNDRAIDIKMTDVEKAEIHGFDKKTSFRHPVK